LVSCGEWCRKWLGEDGILPFCEVWSFLNYSLCLKLCIASIAFWISVTFSFLRFGYQLACTYINYISTEVISFLVESCFHVWNVIEIFYQFYVFFSCSNNIVCPFFLCSPLVLKNCFTVYCQTFKWHMLFFLKKLRKQLVWCANICCPTIPQTRILPIGGGDL
jgi:hypothetical protein